MLVGLLACLWKTFKLVLLSIFQLLVIPSTLEERKLDQSAEFLVSNHLLLNSLGEFLIYK